ncbi:hypothetical protein [Fervidobacterium thailandense]|uniref:Uncharacterized protein n=1 Tax=Fervidobacterium thailandense TaxID=1008305 RepID=A0A1E3G2H2_9BACT|nr:hypothetical protein [Fervidobacterium thailandense]ODN30449.1 hypothetical protein A4H02_05295 [Fervidobacterium thailandense]
MLWGTILLTAGICIILAIVLSVTSPVWLALGSIAIASGIVTMAKGFPNGIGLTVLGGLIVTHALGYLKIGFWEFVVALLGAGLIELGLKLIITSHRKKKSSWNSNWSSESKE